METIKTITKTFNCGDTVVARLCKYSTSVLWILTITLELGESELDLLSNDEQVINIEPQSLQEAQELLAEMQKEGDKLCK